MIKTPPTLRNHWFQNNPHVAILIGIALILFCGVVAVAVWLQPAFRQRSAKLIIEADGGQVGCNSTTAPLAPEWVGSLLGIDFDSEITYVRIESDAPAEVIRDLPGIQLLWLEGSLVTDATMRYLEGRSGPAQLYIIDTNITAVGLSNLEKMSDLRGMSLKGKNVSDEWLEQLSQIGIIRQLEFLLMNNCGVTDHGLKLLENSTHIENLGLPDAKITDVGLKYIKNFSGLYSLNLDNTNISDAGMENLSAFTKLKILSLNNTKLTDVGFKQLRKLTHLGYLSLAGTSITDASLEIIAGFHNLETLDVSNTQVSPMGVSRLRNALPNCSVTLWYDASTDGE